MTTNFFSPSLLLLFLDPGSGMGKIRIRDKHPGSATLAGSSSNPGSAPQVFPSEQTSNEEKGMDMKFKGQFHRGQKVSITCETNSRLMECG
jgi:hypothetical protein